MRYSSGFSVCTTTILLLLFLTSPVFSALTKEDIEAIRMIVKEDVRAIIKEEITASEKRMKEHVDLRIQTVNARIDGIKTRIDGVDARIDGVNTRIDGVNTRIEALDKQLGRIWGVIIALIGLIAATIAIPQIMVVYKDINSNKKGPRDAEPENISA